MISGGIQIMVSRNIDARMNFVIGISMGVVSALRQHSNLDHSLTIGSLFLYSMPSFWLSLMLALVFAVKLHVVHALNKRFHNVEMNALSPYFNLQEWFVPKGKQLAAGK